MRKVQLVVFVLFFSLTTSSFAQQSSTSVRGTVTDPQNRVVSGATVTVSDPTNGLTRTATTDANGYYEFLQLPPSTFTISAKAPGFNELRKEKVELLVNSPSTLNFNLKVQTVSQTVEVTTEAATVNTQDASLGNAFDANKILNLPMEGRQVGEILSLQPGVVYVGRSDSVDTTYDSRGGAVNGGRSDQTNVVLDGVDNNDQLHGFAFTGALRSTPDSLEEFRVSTANSNADAGRSSGGQLSLVTKSGTNNFHGTLYEYHRPTLTTANDWFNKAAQLANGLPNRPGKLIRNTFGGSIGGPIWKDRIFFFGNYEGQRTRESTQVSRIVPSLSMRQGIIKYLCDATDPNCNTSNSRVSSTSQGLLVTLTPADILSMDPVVQQGVDPSILPILQGYPAPNQPSQGDGFNTQGFTFSAPSPQNLNTYIAKLDFRLTQDGRHNLFLRGNLQHDHTAGRDVNGPQLPGLPPDQITTDTNRGIAAGYTAMITNHLINEFRYGYVRQTGSVNGVDTTHNITFRGLDTPFGTNRTTATVVPVHNFLDTITWTRGKHNLQFGGDIRVINNLRASNSGSFSDGITNVSWLDQSAIANTGTSFDPHPFGFPAVDPNFASNYDNPMIVLAGIVSEVDTTFNLTKTLAPLPEGSFVNRHFRAHEWEFFGQDAWHVTPNLVLTGGLRYTLLQPPYETTGTQVAPTFSLHDWFQQRGADMFQGIPTHPLISFNLSGQANGKKPYWNYDRADYAPRFAFAWSPDANSGWLHRLFGGPGKTSVRGGYGIYYDHFGEGIVNTFDRNGSFGLSTGESNPAGIQNVDCAPRLVSLTTLPTGTFCGQNVTPQAPQGHFPVTPPSDLFAITWGLDDRLKTPYSHVFDFSVSRELGKGFVWETAYVGRLGRRLLQQKDLAMPLNLVDKVSGVDYFTAMTQLVKLADSKTPIASVPNIPYWQNLFPGAAGPGLLSGNKAGTKTCNPSFEGAVPASPSATQNIYDLVTCAGKLHNETSTLFKLDLQCFPSCSIYGPNAYFDNQYSSLYAWTSEGTSSYNALQVMLRKTGGGLNFDLNYTYGHSIDVGSDAERVSLFEGFGFGDQIINSWKPNALRASSDFDVRHSINANWIYELPYGHGKRWDSSHNAILDAIIGGWASTGLFRWNSAFPFSVSPGLGFWPTNWELTGAVINNGPRPQTGTFFQNGVPNAFKNPTAAINDFRFSYPGESGQRNNLRGPGYFGADMGLSKSWNLTEAQSLKFSWEVFNVTNSVRFDVGTLVQGFNASLVNSTSFGKYSSTLSKPRIMQFGLRYSF